jgi:hypothetical protein
MFMAWMRLAFDSARLYQEVQMVIALRMMKLALGGPHAEREARRMIAEKGIAFAEAASRLAVGGSVAHVMGSYSRRVSANRRRLSRR